MQILPEDNKAWLTLFYSLPEELVSKRPAYMNLLSLDQLMEDAPDSITSESASFEEDIMENQTFKAFAATLSERDQQILQLKADGFTLKEIAVKVGYQNHSAVSKRIHHISEKYAEYRNQ